MLPLLNERCETYIQNRNLMKEYSHPFGLTLIHMLCAIKLTNSRVSVTVEKLKESRQLLKSRFSSFSGFRGNLQPLVVVMLAMKDDPDAYIENSAIIYEKLKKHFRAGQYTALSALVLSNMIHANEADPYIEKGKQLYNMMKKHHPWITAGDDSALAVLLAFSEKSESTLESEIEQTYDLFKQQYGKGNALQTVSHILSLPTDDLSQLRKKFDDLYHTLKARGVKYGKQFHLPVLAAAALTPMPVDTLAEHICDAQQFLKTQKGYHGIFGLDKYTRYMHATLLVLGLVSQGDDPANDLASITGTLSFIAAQQAAMMAVVAGSTAAAASSN